MAGKQAKTLTRAQLTAALKQASGGRYGVRNRVIFLLSTKAGLRAGEIAKLTWPMLLGPDGSLAAHVDLHDVAAKKRSGRQIPIHPDLRRALLMLQRLSNTSAYVVTSERGGQLRPNSIVNWFKDLYAELGYAGCSSHSGRRTFITTAARLVGRVGGSLRDVQQLAGHRSIEQTQAYIDSYALAKRRLIDLL